MPGPEEIILGSKLPTQHLDPKYKDFIQPEAGSQPFYLAEGRRVENYVG